MACSANTPSEGVRSYPPTRKRPSNGLIAGGAGCRLGFVAHEFDTRCNGLLVAWGEGDRAAHSELMEIVYSELKGLAKAYLRREYANQSFAATALVHEAYLKLVDQRQCIGATGATSSASRRRPCAVSLSIAPGRPWRRSEAALTRSERRG